MNYIKCRGCEFSHITKDSNLERKDKVTKFYLYCELEDKEVEIKSCPFTKNITPKGGD